MEPADDFWWLPYGIHLAESYVYLGHHDPVPDEVAPYEVSWIYHLDESDRGTTSKNLYPATFIPRWREHWHDENVYRSMEVYTSPTGGEPIWGPFLVDVDNERENLADALNVTRAVTSYFTQERALPEEALRVFFTGRKGFNVELRPSDVGSATDSGAEVARDKLIRFLRQEAGESWLSNQVSQAGTVIDRFHEYVRLGGSLNCWQGEGGKREARRKTPLTVNELNSLDMGQIVNRARLPGATREER